MSRLDDVARERTDLSDADVDVLRALVESWTLLADLAFADLVLWLPTWHGGGFVAAEQVRPTTGPTHMFDDIVGTYVPRGRRPLLDRAVAERALVSESSPSGSSDEPAYVDAIPVPRDGRVLGNEMAPRPHNSGHWTIDACATSQFEQLVRAICGLPLGPVDVIAPSRMENLIGDEADAWLRYLADPTARLHLYGKAEARPGRKMGHVTFLPA